MNPAYIQAERMYVIFQLHEIAIMLQSNGKEVSHDSLLLDNRQNPNLYKNYLWKKIPVLYGNILFQEHPEGQQ